MHFSKASIVAFAALLTSAAAVSPIEARDADVQTCRANFVTCQSDPRITDTSSCQADAKQCCDQVATPAEKAECYSYAGLHEKRANDPNTCRAKWETCRANPAADLDECHAQAKECCDNGAADDKAECYKLTGTQ
ncbi:hypothetical protein DIS24_g8814 [Lasiodiplodia hormozganensis]|uniref:Uncharacterized protein n=1 Tax=Lasiodiplodia hormozganensis TaxID=869390 RepID=A0AA40CKV7_9PEZI|nr:hypothetical protein DIS24_g8814 [Lasiodiplodia hormozganensis]